MKRTALKLGVSIVILSAATLCLHNVSKEKQIDELMTNNIEALASGEGGGILRCFGSGTVDCQGYQVSHMYSGFSLDDFE